MKAFRRQPYDDTEELHYKTFKKIVRMKVDKHYVKGTCIESCLSDMKESFLMNTAVKHWDEIL